MKNFSKTLLVIMVGTMGVSSCADSWEEMRKEKYEKEWVKTFGEVDPNHTWNLATQVTADLAIKEDALTEYTFKVYTSDPIWGTDAKLLAKATVKTDEVGYAETQIKFDAPSSQERYYITRTDSHGRRLLKVSDIENKKIGVKFGISNYSAESRAGLITEGDFPVIEDLLDEEEELYTEDIIRSIIENDSTIEFKDRENGHWNFSFAPAYKVSVDNYEFPDFNFEQSPTGLGTYKLIINAENCTIKYAEQIKQLDIIIPKDKSLIIGNNIKLLHNARIFIMEGGTLTAMNGTGIGENSAIRMDSKNYKTTEKNEPIIYNAGTINSNYITIKEGNLYNAPTGIINNTNTIQFQNQDTGTLTNYGKLHSESIFGNGRTEDIGALVSGQQGTINNACFIDVDTEFNIFNLNLAANSAVESRYIIVNNVTLRQSSILRCDEFSAQNSYWEFVGNRDVGRALISTQHTSYLHDGGININGPIFYESNTFKDPTDKVEIERASSDGGIGCGVVGSAPFLIVPDGYYDEDDDISQADCVGHGNIPAEFEDIVDESIEWVVAFEDLGATGDYDFNDVVIGISHDQENNTIKVTPLAAGGTLPVHVLYEQTDLGEVHQLLQEDAPTNVPINVNNRGNNGTDKIIEVESFSITQDWKNFKITVNGNHGTRYDITPNKEAGSVPQAICIPAPWFWAKEGINIHDAYIQFGGWVNDQTANQKWHQNPIKEKVAL